jgi:hypothetical protein
MKRMIAIKLFILFCALGGIVIYKMSLEGRSYKDKGETLVLGIPDIADRARGLLSLKVKKDHIYYFKDHMSYTLYVKYSTNQSTELPDSASSLVSFSIQKFGYLDSLINPQQDFAYAMYGEQTYPDRGLRKFGLSYRPQMMPDRAEELLQRIYVNVDKGKYKTLIKCIPPISINSISAPKSCEMLIDINSDRLYGDFSIVGEATVDEKRIGDWKVIETSVKNFFKNHVVVKSEGVENEQ